MLFGDYTSLVYRDYESKRAAKTISSRLAHPTSANLRDECIAVCLERFTKRDQSILRTFFGQIGDNKDACIKAIEKYDPDRFRPLVKFLKQEIKETNVKNVDLLAWLIDFRDRPYGLLHTPYKEGNEPASRGSESITAYGNSPAEHAQFISPKLWLNNFTVKKVVVAVLILLSLTAGGYLVWRSEKKAVLTGNEKCMYWAGVQYEPVSCDQNLDGKLIIALDSQRLNHFKKISTPDTITVQSVGKIWYARINGDMEYYTSGGSHPIQIQQQLKPITQYIINKYLHPIKE